MAAESDFGGEANRLEQATERSQAIALLLLVAKPHAGAIRPAKNPGVLARRGVRPKMLLATFLYVILSTSFWLYFLLLVEDGAASDITEKCRKGAPRRDESEWLSLFLAT